MRRLAVVPFLVASVLALGCQKQQTPAPQPEPAQAAAPGTQAPDTTPGMPGAGAGISVRPSVVLPDGFRVWVEPATDEDTRQQGLMYRPVLDKGTGMLFIFPAAGDYPFWMKNTLIPLDMVWIDEAKTIVHVASDVQPCKADPCPNYEPGAKAKYVLELNAGEAAAHHLAPGQTVQILDTDAIEVR